jgi:hypothetical protein
MQFRARRSRDNPPKKIYPRSPRLPDNGIRLLPPRVVPGTGRAHGSGDKRGVRRGTGELPLVDGEWSGVPLLPVSEPAASGRLVYPPAGNTTGRRRQSARPRVRGPAPRSLSTRLPGHPPQMANLGLAGNTRGRHPLVVHGWQMTRRLKQDRPAGWRPACPSGFGLNRPRHRKAW